MPPEIILFVVNETLLDLRALRPLFTQHYGDPNIPAQWFAQLLRSAMVATITGEYHDWDLAGAKKAGCQTAFIARPGMIMGTLQQKPDIFGSDLRIVADQILAN